MSTEPLSSLSLQQPRRLSQLQQYHILDTPPEEQFDRLVDLASRMMGTPSAVVSFIDDHREWMKARKNVDREVLPLEVSFGVHAIQSNDVLVVEDTQDDVRFVKNPLVTGFSEIRFYAGAPLITPTGHRIGTIAVFDTEPRSPSREQITHLKTLAALTVDRLETRRDRSDLDKALKIILNQSGVNTALLDRDGVILGVNDSWKTFAVGNGIQDLSKLGPGTNYLEACDLSSSAPDRPTARRAEEGIRDVLSGERLTFEQVYPCHSPDQKRWFRMRVMALDHPQARAIVSHVNVTDLKRREREHRFLIAAVEQAQEMVIITEGAPLDEPGPRITYVNPAFTEVTGYTPEDVLGKTPRILQGPDTESWVLKKFREHLERGEPYEGETVNYRKDGTPYINHWTVAPVRNDHGTITHWVSVQRDVTEQRQMEKRLLQAQERERQQIAQEMHDEMGGLIAALQMALDVDEIEDDSGVEPTDVAEIEEVVNELSHVVRSLTERLHSRVLEDFGLSGALSRLSIEFQNRTGIAVEVHNELSSAERLPPLVEKTAYRAIREALSNVDRHAESDQVQILLNKTQKTLRVHVIDNGVGFNPETELSTEEQHRLLAIRERLDQINGQLQIDTSPETGTRISLTLPLTVLPSVQS